MVDWIQTGFVSFNGILILQVYVKEASFKAEYESTNTQQDLFKLLDLAWALVSRPDLGLENTIPFLLIEDAMELLDIHGIQTLFEFLESRLDILTLDLVPGKGKALILLRTCNETLRKLSKTENAALCGRIQIFLASVFPLSERSGVNLKGEFNTDNITQFETFDNMDTDDAPRKFFSTHN